MQDEIKWETFTGYTIEDISKFAVKSFKMLVNIPNSNQVTHGTRFHWSTKKVKLLKRITVIQMSNSIEIVKDVKAFIKVGE